MMIPEVTASKNTVSRGESEKAFSVLFVKGKTILTRNYTYVQLDTS